MACDAWMKEKRRERKGIVWEQDGNEWTRGDICEEVRNRPRNMCAPHVTGRKLSRHPTTIIYLSFIGHK